MLNIIYKQCEESIATMRDLVEQRSEVFKSKVVAFNIQEKELKEYILTMQTGITPVNITYDEHKMQKGIQTKLSVRTQTIRMDQFTQTLTHSNDQILEMDREDQKELGQQLQKIRQLDMKTKDTKTKKRKIEFEQQDYEQSTQFQINQTKIEDLLLILNLKQAKQNEQQKLIEQNSIIGQQVRQQQDHLRKLREKERQVISIGNSKQRLYFELLQLQNYQNKLIQ